MCGLCGFVTKDKQEMIGLPELQRMNRTMAHRGPDDEGYWMEGSAGLAHRRLSIIDLSPLGHQPMRFKDLLIVFNGEIYNFLEIREELCKLGRNFVSRSDTEVVMQAYDEWGPSCLHRFNGMFVFAIYDTKKEELFIARDRLGVKPLYYFFDQRHFVFASELKAIATYPYFTKEMDQSAVEHFFAFKYIRAPQTIFKNTYKLEPGHYLICKNMQLTVTPYWRVTDIIQSPAGSEKTEHAYTEELEHLIESAVRYRLISDVPVGAFLSGGIDSSLIAAAMCKVSDHVKTFSIGFHDPRYNEAPYAKKVAEALGTEHQELYVYPKEIFDSIDKLADHFDEPFADPSSLPTYLVSKLARQKVTVALSGDAGDELFWGYARYRKYSAARNFRFLPFFLRNSALSHIEKIPNDFLQKAAQGLQYHDLDECYDYLSGIFKRNHLNNLFNYELKRRPTLFNNDSMPDDHLMRPSWTDMVSYLPDDILTKVDRTSMAVSLEARSPLLDYRIVEFALRLPFKYKYKKGIQKYLLKKILFKHLEPSFFQRPKQGFDLPLNSWFRTDLKPLLLERLSTDRLSRYGFLNVPWVENMMRKHFTGNYDYYYMIWALLSFDLWYEKFYE